MQYDKGLNESANYNYSGYSYIVVYGVDSS